MMEAYSVWLDAPRVLTNEDVLFILVWVFVGQLIAMFK